METDEALEESRFLEAQAEFHARLVDSGMEPMPMLAICSTLRGAFKADWTGPIWLQTQTQMKLPLQKLELKLHGK
jgi:hypothetical protein